MWKRTVSAMLVTACIIGAVMVTGAAGGSNEAPARDGETIILLLADGPLTSGPAPEIPSLDPAGDEVIVNGALVPPVTIQSGLLMRPLYANPVGGHSFSVVEWPAEVSLRRHWHPVTERLWMIEGSIGSVENENVDAGDFWEAPARVSMGPLTSTGSVFAFFGEGPFETYYLDAGEDAPNAGVPFTVDPDTMRWQPLADVLGQTATGSIKVLSPATERDRGVYIVRLAGSRATAPGIYGANLEGYVLSGSLRLSDPYHGIHLLRPGFYFRIPAGFVSSFANGAGLNTAPWLQ